jgi:hypothetical protein
VIGLDVLVVGAAVERDVTVRGNYAGVRIVGAAISAQHEGAKVDLNLAPEPEDFVFFFLRLRANGDVFRFVGWS